MRMSVIRSSATVVSRLTRVSYVVVLEVIPSQRGVLDHAELHSLEDMNVIIKLVVR